MDPYEETRIRELDRLAPGSEYVAPGTIAGDRRALLKEIDELRTQNRELEEAGERLKATLKQTQINFESVCAKGEGLLFALEGSEQRFSGAIAALHKHAEECTFDINDVLAELEK